MYVLTLWKTIYASSCSKGNLWQNCAFVWHNIVTLVPFLHLISNQQHMEPFQTEGRYCRNESCLLCLKNTLVLYTFEQMVNLSTGSVAWLIALDLPFCCFIWVRSGQPYLHRYMNVWNVNKNRIWDVKPCLIIWSGFLELSQSFKEKQ